MPHVPFHLYFILLFLLIVGGQVLMYLLASRFLSGKGVGKQFIKTYLPIIFVVINTPLFLTRIDPDLFYYPGFVRTFIMMPFFAYQTMSLAVVLATVVVYIVRIVLRIWKRSVKESAGEISPDPILKSRRSFIRKGAVGLGAYAFVGSLHSIYDRGDYKIDRVTITLKNLPAKLDGLTISMISDIHSGLYMLEDDMLKYADAVNQLKADMIFIPGDFVTSKNNEVLPLAKAFSGLKSKYGTYACLGNHDFFANPAYITEKLREHGMNVLRNETDELEIEGVRLMLSGVDDGRHANFPKVSYEADSLDTTRILLCHKPYYLENAVAGGFDLMLSGHTHGGQIVFLDLFGEKITPAALVSPYVSGKYRMGKTHMYVSRGIGTVGLPIRVNCPPEVTLFTLRSESKHR